MSWRGSGPNSLVRRYLWVTVGGIGVLLAIPLFIWMVESRVRRPLFGVPNLVRVLWFLLPAVSGLLIGTGMAWYTGVQRSLVALIIVYALALGAVHAVTLYYTGVMCTASTGVLEGGGVAESMVSGAEHLGTGALSRTVVTLVLGTAVVGRLVTFAR